MAMLLNVKFIVFYCGEIVMKLSILLLWCNSQCSFFLKSITTKQHQLFP